VPASERSTLETLSLAGIGAVALVAQHADELASEIATRVGVEPAYVAEWLPGMLLIGFGIGLTFPVLSAAAVSTLPPERFGVGSAVNQTARQVGGAIGVAIMVTLLGRPQDLAAALAGFERLWIYGALMAALAGVVAVALGAPRRAPAITAPAPSS